MAHFAPQAEQEWFAKQLNEEQAFYRCWCLRGGGIEITRCWDCKTFKCGTFTSAVTDLSDYCPKGELIFTDELPFILLRLLISQKSNRTFINGMEKN